MSKKRTITLTGRPPVRIDESSWPLVASASSHDYDGQYDFQSFRHHRWFVGARQHADGRAIVYAKYDYETAWQNERSLSAARGVLLESADAASICDAIANVCEDMSECEHNGNDDARWTSLRDECIADLPAVEI